MNREAAVLTYRTLWEIYDLHLRGVVFAGNLMESLFPGWNTPDEPEEVAHALYHWLSQDLWWHGSA